MSVLCGMKNKSISTDQEQYIAEFKAFLRMRNYAPTTIKSYISAINQFWKFCLEAAVTNPEYDKTKALQAWFWHITEKFGAGTVFTQNYSALKLFFVHILKRDWSVYGIVRPRRVRNLPEIMSKIEVEKLIEQATCLKHQTIFLTLYATGMRMNEVVSLKIEDINPQTMTLRVRMGKGRKDRFLPLSQPLLAVIDQYVEQYKPAIFLFNGATIGHPLCARAVQNAFQLAKQKARLNPKITPHTLRHAFATHHLDNGTHLGGIKEMLGHANLKSTQRYLHLSVQSLHQFTNPADDLCKRYIK